MNIYQKILAVRKAVGYIRKEKRVGEGGYLAVTHDAVTEKTREHFIEHGVLVTPPSLISSATVLTGTTTAKGIPFVRYEAKYKFWAINADDPSDKFDFDMEAHAIDQGDKAPGKALSYAKKYAVLKLLEIESGEEEEERADQHKPKPHKSVANETWDKLTEASKKKLTDHTIALIDFFNEGEDQKAFEYYTEVKEKLEVDEQVAFWSRLDSEQRATIKRLGEAHKKAEEARKKLRSA